LKRISRFYATLILKAVGLARFESKCVTELNTTTFGIPSFEIEPSKFEDLKPEQLFMRLIV